MKKREQLHKMARQTGKIIDWERFRSSGREVKEKLQNAEKTYVNHEIRNNQGTNSMWKVIKKGQT